MDVEIKGFIETSFVDWPGKVASVVFLPGCNYRCPYCHNHRLVTGPGELLSWPFDYVRERLETLRDWVDGVCVTGGEPTLHPGIFSFLERFQAQGWAVKLDTNGSRPEVLRELLAKNLAAAVSMDVKAPLEDIPYRRNGGPGADPVRARESLKILAGWGGPVELRTTVHPALLSLEELKRLAAQLAELFGKPPVWKLQRCRVEDTLDPAMGALGPVDAELLARWEDLLAKPAAQIGP